MADIARIFLDGARNTPTTGVPKRVGPGERAPTPQPAVPAPVETRADAPRKPLESWTLPKALLGLSGASGEAAWNLLLSAAAGIATDHATTVCLLGVRDNQFVVELVGLESPDDAPRLAPGAGMVDMQVARALFTLRDAVGLWLIASPELRSESFAQVIGRVPQWLLAASDRNDSVVAAYQQMKQALSVGAFEETPRAFIVTEKPSEAAEVHNRLRKAAKDFLRQDLAFGGAGMPTTGALRIATILLNAEDRTAVWAAVMDELCVAETVDEFDMPPMMPEASAEAMPVDVETALEQVAAASAQVEDVSANFSAASSAMFDQLAHVLDPEERAALAADLGPLSPLPALATPTMMPPGARFAIDIPESQAAAPAVPVKASLGSRMIVEPAAASSSVVPAAASHAPAASPASRGVTLRAFDVLENEDRDRAAQWQAVERSIRDLVADSVLLDAKPPMSWASDCCIAIDGHGGLHIWTLFKDGVSWFALREWAAEHRNLLALTRRDLVLDAAADVSVHIVLPLESELASDTPTDIRSLLRTPSKSVFLYRLRAVQWNTRRGILVVPIA